MPRQTDHNDDWDDERDWDSHDDGEPTIACPKCREQIHEDAPQCPYCGHYVSDDEARSSPKPWWLIIGAILALLGSLSWMM